MDETQKELENRKKKILNKIIPFMKEPLNLALVTVLLFAFVLRLYYFIKVGNQPLWWDELCYGSLAKNFITHTWDSTTLILGETAIRPVLFPLLWSILLRVGIPEGGVRFFLEFIPSILSVFFVYLIGKETFNKRVGIISAFIFSVLWIHLFYTVRLLTHAPALVFLFSSIYLFMKATETKFNFNLFTISLILLSLSTLMRYPKGIIFFVYLFMLVIDKKLLLKNFKFWKAGILGISPMIVFFIYNFVKYQNIFPALLGGGYLDKGGSPLIKPIAFNLLNFIPVYLKTTFFIFFLIGLLLILFELITGYNLIPKIKKLKNSLILILILILIYSFFIFYMRAAEDRWLFPTILPLAIITSLGIDFVYNQIKKYNKQIAVLCVILILGFGAYSQLTFADSLIKGKQESYLQMRQAFEWIGSNTPEDSIIAGLGIEPYTVYYAKRDYINLPQNYSEVGVALEADYLVAHLFAGNPPKYLSEYLSENQDIWQPLNAWFLDEAKTQPAVILYKKVQ